MGSWVVLAVLAASGGEVTQAQDLSATREATRFHAAVGVVGTFGFGGFTLGGGPGLTGELGVTVQDRSTFAVRGSLGTVLLLTAASLGVSWDYALSDRWSLGTGAMFGYVGGFLATDLPNALLVHVPLRAQFAFWARDPRHVSRSGLKLFLEAGPGVVVAGSRGYRPPTTEPLPRWAVMTTLGLSWTF